MASMHRVKLSNDLPYQRYAQCPQQLQDRYLWF